jgi:hypothetical protein
MAGSLKNFDEVWAALWANPEVKISVMHFNWFAQLC